MFYYMDKVTGIFGEVADQNITDLIDGNYSRTLYLDKVTGTFGDQADLMIFFNSTPATADELAEMGDTERLEYVLRNVPRAKQIHNGPLTPAELAIMRSGDLNAEVVA